MGTDQYTGYQGDPGNLRGYEDNISVAALINYTNQQSGDPAVVQYNIAQLVDSGNLLPAVISIEQRAQLVEAAVPTNAGGNPALGALEIANSPAAGIVLKTMGGIACIAGIAALPEIAAGAAILGTVAALGGGLDGIAGDTLKAEGVTPGPGYIPHDANTQTLFNDIGRVAAQAARAVIQLYAVNPEAGVQGARAIGGSPHLLASIGTFTNNAAGQPIFALNPHS